MGENMPPVERSSETIAEFPYTQPSRSGIRAAAGPRGITRAARAVWTKALANFCVVSI